MALLDKIRRADDRRRIGPLTIPEWGVTEDDQVYQVSMTADQGDEFDTLVAKNMDKDGRILSAKGIRARVLLWTLVDAQGQPVFDLKDIPMLAGKSNLVIGRLYQQAMDLSGKSEKGRQEAEEALKNAPTSEPSCDSAASGGGRLVKSSAA